MGQVLEVSVGKKSRKYWWGRRYLGVEFGDYCVEYFVAGVGKANSCVAEFGNGLCMVFLFAECEHVGVKFGVPSKQDRYLDS